MNLTRFDRIVALIIAGLLAAIGGTILLGDHIGVQVESAGPSGTAASTSRIVLRFSETMDWDSVIEHLAFDPQIEGQFHSSGRTLRFSLAAALTPGSRYDVTLRAGAVSESGRQVLDDTSFSFEVRAPRVVYLSPADTVPQNVWMADPAQPDSATQITFSPSGILNFDVSPDGNQIAIAERGSAGVSNIKLLDLVSGDLIQVTNCTDADCNTPVWRPDGSMITYNRIDLNSDMPQVGVSPTRVWLVDMATTPPSERPLFSDNQILGYGPQWSADGRYIALFDNSNRAILIQDMDTGTTNQIPSQSGGDIALAPNGRRLVFPRLIYDQSSATTRSILQMADLDAGHVADLIDESEPVDDDQSAWHPDGQRLVIARRYTDERATETRQLYLLDIRSATVEPLVIDPRYYNGFFSWDPLGEQLVIQRFPQFTEDGDFNSNGRPEIWTYDLSNDTLTLIAENAYLPRWIP